MLRRGSNSSNDASEDAPRPQPSNRLEQLTYWLSNLRNVFGLPFLLLVGAAPNAIAYESGQFTAGEFFTYGILASIILMVVVAFAVYFIWPLMGMPMGA